MSTPIGTSERLVSLDIVRGIAILAVVFVNIVALAGPQWGMFDPGANGPASVLDLVVFYAVRVLISGKFISIFALLFGMGLALQTQRIEEHGSSTGIYLRRQGVLLGMGVLHGVLLWWGDILTTYAVLGTLVFFVRGASATDLRRLAAGLIGIGVVMQFAAFLSLGAIPGQLQMAADALREFGDVPSGLVLALEDDGVFGLLSKLEIQAFGTGPLWLSLPLRTVLFLGTVIGGLFSLGPWIGGLMMLGVAFVREDFMHDQARQRWWVRWGIGVGLALEITTNGVAAIGGYSVLSPIGATMEAFGVLAKPLLALGCFSLLLLLCERSRVLNVFAPVGRMALTNYIGQSLVLNVLFVHWGFGWFGTLGRAQTFGICMVLVTAQVLFSHLWLRYFARGPLESLWRHLTYNLSAKG